MITVLVSHRSKTPAEVETEGDVNDEEGKDCRMRSDVVVVKVTVLPTEGLNNKVSKVALMESPLEARPNSKQTIVTARKKAHPSTSRKETHWGFPSTIMLSV